MITEDGYSYIIFNRRHDKRIFGGMKKVSFVLKYKKGSPVDVLVRLTPIKAKYVANCQIVGHSKEASNIEYFNSEYWIASHFSNSQGLVSPVAYGTYMSKWSRRELPVMFQPYYSEGSLWRMLQKHPNLTTGDRLDIVENALLGMTFMHAEGFYHRDIKTDNILVNKRDGKYIADLADFGLSLKSTDPIQRPCGTVGHVCTEIIAAAGDPFQFNEKMDIWALGQALLEMYLPQATYANLADYELREYLHKMMNFNPLVRPTAGEAFSAVQAIRKRYS
jgi:serine/threonine protein kinase